MATCSTCGRCMRLERWDWSNVLEQGVPKTKEDGFACLAFVHEGLVIHAVGLDEDADGCEMWCAR